MSEVAEAAIDDKEQAHTGNIMAPVGIQRCRRGQRDDEETAVNFGQ